MRKIVLATVLIGTVGLGGCADQLQKFKDTISAAVNVYERVTTATVTPTQIEVVATAFDGVKSAATGYLVYCKGNLSAAICTADTRRKVISDVRLGTKARNQLEPYITSGGAGPGDVYNTLVDMVNDLNTQPITKTGG